MGLFYIPDGSKYESYIDILIDGLLRFEGVGLEFAGVFVGCDCDVLNIPDYLDRDGFDISFEYMDEYVVCSMIDGAKYIEEWCVENVVADRESVLEDCNNLVRLYGGMSELTRTEMPGECLLDMFVSSGMSRGDYVEVMLEKLLKCEGVSAGVSGVYLECDKSSEDIPVYLRSEKNKMSFEFEGGHVVCSMFVGACYIRDWCEKNVCSKGFGSRRGTIMAVCNKLVGLYEGFDGV